MHRRNEHIGPSAQTRLLHSASGFAPERDETGPVNPGVVRASTLLARDVESFERLAPYATKGTATTKALEEALLSISDGAGTCHLHPSGLAAIATVLLALTKADDHVLLSDALYYPTRRLMKQLLSRHGVTASFFDPRAETEAIITQMRENTSVLFLESPGSDSMEVLDIPALAQAARERGIVPVIDDTWSAGWLFDPFGAGCLVSVQALTKYQCGHADVLMGAVLCARDAGDALAAAVAERIAATHQTLGQCASGDDAWLMLRGLRTMPLRLQRHGESALKIAHWLQGRPEVAAVLHPALPGAVGHEFFARDFSGASGLFSFVLKPEHDDDAVSAMLDGLELFGLGASWGGYESLIMRKNMRQIRSHPWPYEGWLIRLSIGLEEPEDLIADLAAGFERLSCD